MGNITDLILVWLHKAILLLLLLLLNFDLFFKKLSDLWVFHKFFELIKTYWLSATYFKLLAAHLFVLMLFLEFIILAHQTFRIILAWRLLLTIVAVLISWVWSVYCLDLIFFRLTHKIDVSCWSKIISFSLLFWLVYTQILIYMVLCRFCWMIRKMVDCTIDYLSTLVLLKHAKIFNILLNLALLSFWF